MEILLSCTTTLFAVLAYILSVVFMRRHHRGLTWEQILEKITPIDRETLDSLTEISQMYLHPESHQLKLQPAEMWERIGGLRGVMKLKRNAAAMLDLAVYAEHWDVETSRLVAEMIRRDVHRLSWVLLMIELSFLLRVRYLSVRLPFNVQEAAGLYMLIRSRLLTFYNTAHAGRVEPIAELI